MVPYLAAADGVRDGDGLRVTTASGEVVQSPDSAPSPSSQPVSFTLTGKGIKRVKPKRTTSFFSRQLSTSQGSYTVVQPTDNSLEQS